MLFGMCTSMVAITMHSTMLLISNSVVAILHQALHQPQLLPQQVDLLETGQHVLSAASVSINAVLVNILEEL
jgi:hypothetical protein